MNPTFRMRLLATLSLALLTFPLAAEPSATGEAAFDWQAVPTEARLARKAPFTSDRFKWLGSATDTIRIRFEWPEGDDSFRELKEPLRFLVATPPGGIRDTLFEGPPPRYFLRGEEVTPDPNRMQKRAVERLHSRELGEYRGVKLFLLEFQPYASVSGSTETDSAWVSGATLTLVLGDPFGVAREVGKPVLEAFRALALNGEDLPRCLPPSGVFSGLPADARALWERPALKVRTREMGWHVLRGTEIKQALGPETRIERLELATRAAAIGAGETQAPGAAVTIPWMVVGKEGKARREGVLQGEDRFLFLAPESKSPTDPRTSLWLTENPEGPAHQPPEPATPTLAAGIPIRTTGIMSLSLGKDREFIESAPRTEQQAAFWVDRAFEEVGETTREVRIALPEELRRGQGGIQATARLLFGSSIKDRYSPQQRLGPGDLSGLVGPATFTPVVRPAENGIGWTCQFALDPEILGPTLTLRYAPKARPKNPLYFDRLDLEWTEILEWYGEKARYRFAPPAYGTLQVELTGGSLGEGGATSPPELILGETVGGTAFVLEGIAREGGLEIRCPIPVVALHLLHWDHLMSPESEAFRLPSWAGDPPRVEELVLSPEVFKADLQTLLAAHRARGRECAWLDVQDVFDLFGGGQFSPHALKSFLAWVSETWPDPRPHSVFLVGDSSWDAWGRYPHAKEVPNWTPSFHTDLHPDYPSDHWFIEGQTGDRVGDWFFGRIPCQTRTHLQGFLSKLGDHRRLGAQRPSGRFVWVTDDNHPFESNLREVWDSSLPLSLRWDHVRVRDYSFTDNFYYGAHLARIQEEARKAREPLDFGKISPDCNRAVRDSLSRGATLFVYHGHSGLNVLAHERILFGGRSIFSDVPSLTNGGDAPLAFLMTCDVGRYDYAENPKWSEGLAEELLFHPRGGCLALVTSTGRGVPDDHLSLLKGFFSSLFNSPTPSAGATLWAGKALSLISRPSSEGIDMFTLLGDPLFQPPIPSEAPGQITRIRWKKDGALEVELDLGELLAGWPAGSSRTLEVWRVGDELVEEWRADKVSVPRQGPVRLEIPGARELDRLFLGYRLAGNPPDGDAMGALNGWAAADLIRLGRPNWSELAGSGSPNLTLEPEDVSLENPSPPKSGDTVFLRATVRNTGTGAAEQVVVAAYGEDEAEPLPTFANYPEAVLKRLLPGERETVRLRWDMWEGTGERIVTVKVDPKNTIAESNEADNEALKTVRILGKPDLGWGLVKEATEAAVDYSRARSIPSAWVLRPDSVDFGPLGHLSELRPYLAEADRGVILDLPLSNFGDTPSATTTLKISYFRDSSETPALEMKHPPIRPIPGSVPRLKPRTVWVVLLPGFSKVVVEVDPDRMVDEVRRDNNRVTLAPKEALWERFPSLKPVRVPPKALRSESE